MTPQQPFCVVILKAAGYGFNPIGLSKCNIWVAAKLYSAHLISSEAQKFSQWHQHLQFSGAQWETKARLQVILLHLDGAPWPQKLQPGESPGAIYMHNHTVFQHGVPVFLLRYSSGSKQNWISTSRKASQQQQIYLSKLTNPKHLKARLDQ